MTQIQENKPVRTIKEILGIKEDTMVPLGTVAKAQEPADLPMAEAQSVELPKVEKAIEEAMSQVEPVSQQQVAAQPLIVKEYGSPLTRFLSKPIVRYALLFVVAFGVFYAILNFRAIGQQIASWTTNLAKSDAANQILESPAYKKWFQKFYVFVNDPQVFLANNDPDGDGLTNLYEFYLGTNPLEADTDRDGYNDGREVLNGFNPLYSGTLTAEQIQIVAKYTDRESIESRQNLGRVAGENILPIVDNFQLDPSQPGFIEIPKLKVEAPIVWSKTYEGMEDDLKYGTAHHPGTKYPGEWGMASIHGHSSGNFNDGGFKTVFTKLNFLEAGDEVIVTVYGTKKQERKYRYLVRSKQIYAKEDSEQFADKPGYFLNLSTSWPVGTAHERYVVTTELVGVSE